MGLVVKVMCRCFVEGKVQAPFSKPINVAEDGSLYLDFPWEDNEEAHNLFHRWRESGCEHPRMVYASDIINWTAYRLFQQALGGVGWEHFPTLKAELPNTNDGATPASAAAKMLAELSFFSESADLGQVTVLVDSDTGEELHQYVAAYGGEFRYGPTGDTFGVDEAGFFIRLKVNQTQQEVFRAKRIEQIVPDPSTVTTGDQLLVEFVNLDTDYRFAYPEPVVKIVYGLNGALQNAEGQIRMGYPHRMHVSTRKRTAADFEAAITVLRTVCEAAIEIGNPIAWW
jgi:hypothetical protein